METFAAGVPPHRSGAKVATILLTLALLGIVTIQAWNGQYQGRGIGAWIGVLVDLPIAVLAWLCWMRGWAASPRVVRAGTSGLAAGLAIGAVCFAIGFVGPLILSPNANLGPLVGIIVTGPVGFLLGSVAGAVYGFVRSTSDVSFHASAGDS